MPQGNVLPTKEKPGMYNGRPTRLEPGHWEPLQVVYADKEEYERCWPQQAQLLHLQKGKVLSQLELAKELLWLSDPTFIVGAEAVGLELALKLYEDVPIW